MACIFVWIGAAVSGVSIEDVPAPIVLIAVALVGLEVWLSFPVLSK